MLPLKAARTKSFISVIHHSFIRRRFIGLSLIVGNLLLLSAIIAFIVYTPKNTIASQAIVAGNQTNVGVENPLDQLSSATIALTVARLDNLPETTAVANQADSEMALLSFAPANNSVITKPQVVATDYVSNKDIKTYMVISGDTISSIAQKFGLSTNSILWSNNISGDSVTPGVKLLIPPVNGIVYHVKSGDTVASLAQKYSSDQNLITAYNDAEINGIYPGEQILIPNGTVPSVVSYARTTTATYGWGSQASYGYNGYDFGYCTYWVAKLRSDAGHPLPTDLGDASTWIIRASEFGLPEGATPVVGAAVVTSTYGEGHVAYVTAVNADGTITISEMNHDGWDVVDTRNLPAAGYEYIY